MLGSRAEAEDVVQEAYIRWHQADETTVRNPEAWLVTTATRLAIDRLRALKVEREAYVGPWLPEPLIGSPPPELTRLTVPPPGRTVMLIWPGLSAGAVSPPAGGVVVEGGF